MMGKNKFIMLITTGAIMELARWSKRARTSMMAVMVIRPRGEDEVEKAAEDETASLPITVLVVVVL